VLLSDFPGHESIPHIKESREKQKQQLSKKPWKYPSYEHLDITPIIDHHGKPEVTNAYS
jgi:hypothetical protein